MKKNNVLVIMSDEHTRSVMGAYGNAQVHTPTLDKLSNSGMRFEHAYTPSPICISARASFATGTHVFENRCWSSAQPYYGQQESWMHRLRHQGSEVVSIGKLHYRSAKDDLGFSDQQHPMYLANQGRGWPQGLQRSPMPDYPDAAELAAGVGPGETSYTGYDRNITAASVKWLRDRKISKTEKPWVLFVSFICPHYPLSAPEEFYSLYRDMVLPAAYDNDPDQQLKHPVIDKMRQFWNYDSFFDEEGRIEALRNYYGLCSFLDDNVRQVLEALEQSSEGDNTQIIYTSDHGDLIGNHGMWCKSYMYEDSVGIPMTLTGPGIKPGVNKTPVSLVDLASTIESFVTGDIPSEREAWRGRPLPSFIESPDADRPVLSEYHDGGSPTGFYMLRQGPWKYIYFAENNPDLLFNMAKDPQEIHNLADLAEFVTIKTGLLNILYSILDPELVNQSVFEDQATVIEALGGVEGIRNMKTFNHTPIGS
jgi:choline-sulfatase